MKGAPMSSGPGWRPPERRYDQAWAHGQCRPRGSPLSTGATSGPIAGCKGARVDGHFWCPPRACLARAEQSAGMMVSPLASVRDLHGRKNVAEPSEHEDWSTGKPSSTAGSRVRRP
jgi:hypothetical protein